MIYRRLPPNCLSTAEQNVRSRTYYGTIDSEVQKGNYSGSSLKKRSGLVLVVRVVMQLHGTYVKGTVYESCLNRRVV